MFQKTQVNKQKIKKKKSLIVYSAENLRINLAQLYPVVQYYHYDAVSLHLLVLLSHFCIILREDSCFNHLL